MCRILKLAPYTTEELNFVLVYSKKSKTSKVYQENCMPVLWSPKTRALMEKMDTLMWTLSRYCQYMTTTNFSMVILTNKVIL